MFAVIKQISILTPLISLIRQLVEPPEYLDTLAGLHFSRVNVAGAVYRDVVNRSELAGLPTAAKAVSFDIFTIVKQIVEPTL